MEETLYVYTISYASKERPEDWITTHAVSSNMNKIIEYFGSKGLTVNQLTKLTELVGNGIL